MTDQTLARTPEALEALLSPARLDAIGSAEKAAEHILAVHQATKNEIGRLEAVLEKAKVEMAMIMAETGQQQVKTAAGTAYWTKPGKTVSYPKAKLEAYAKQNPDFARMLGEVKVEKERPGSLVFK